MPYITPIGFQKLADELDYLWRTKRPEVTRSVSEAAALGDRSENAEYIYGKKQLREIDSRIRFLTKRLESLKVVDKIPDNQERIFFGAYVLLENSEGVEKEIRIVGSDEFDHHKAYISVKSPLARALIGKEIDDEITLNLEMGIVRYSILAIHY